jgi:membrane protein YqaA with SNARE-associated domain
MTIIIATLAGQILSFLYSAILYFLGKILSNSTELRRFLSLNKQDENPQSFYRISTWVENIGWILKILAIISVFTSIVTTISIIANTRF